MFFPAFPVPGAASHVGLALGGAAACSAGRVCRPRLAAAHPTRAHHTNDPPTSRFSGPDGGKASAACQLVIRIFGPRSFPKTFGKSFPYFSNDIYVIVDHFVAVQSSLQFISIDSIRTYPNPNVTILWRKNALEEFLMTVKTGSLFEVKSQWLRKTWKRNRKGMASQS